MKQNFVRFFSSDDVLRGKVKNILKAEPMCINHTVRTFVENHSTLATSCSLKPAVPKYIFPDFDTLGLALLRNSSQDARYRQSTEHLPEKNSEQTVWMAFSFGGLFIIYKLFWNIWL